MSEQVYIRLSDIARTMIARETPKVSAPTKEVLIGSLQWRLEQEKQKQG